MADERRIGLQSQLDELDRQLGAGRKLGGWKVGLTSGQARDSMGAGFRPFGYVLADRILNSGDSVALASGGPFGVENEVCFQIGERLSGTVSPEAVLAAISRVAPAFEIIERRGPRDVSSAARLADNLSQWGIVVGEDRLPAEVEYDAVEVSLFCNEALVETVSAAGHIDAHLDSIAALAAQLGEFGKALEPGQRVITGSYTKQAVSGAGAWRGSFDSSGIGTPLGDVSVVFA